MSSEKSIKLKNVLLATTFLTVGAAGAAQAQDNNSETVVVTGTRIVRDGYSAPTPLAVVSTEQIQTNANSNLQQALTNLPAFAGVSATLDSNANGGSNAGLSTLNLRGLGANRTLVLLDGKRMTFGFENGQVDISLVPQQLVERVDVVTGGASAVYGSDAIAGVVNFVLEKNFTGFKGEVSGGETAFSDGQNLKVDLTAGTGFDNDRGHIEISTEVVRDDGIRDFGQPVRNWQLKGAQQISNPNYVPGNGQPQFEIVDGVGYSQAGPAGMIATGPLQGIEFGQGGAPSAAQNGILSNSYKIGGDWQRDNPRLYEDVEPAQQREDIYARASYDVTSDIQVYGEVERTRAKISGQAQPASFVGAAGPLIQIGNPYLPASVVAQMQSAGVTSFNLGTENLNIGALELVTDRYMTFGDVGATGAFNAFGKDWTWDVFAKTGLTDGYLRDLNNISRTKFLQASNAVVGPKGQIECSSTLTNPNDGCVPYNPMGFGVTNATDPGRMYVVDPSWEILDITESTVGGTLTGNPFSVWAGPVSVALNAEYRKDKTQNTADPDSVAANHPFGTFPQTRGESDVWEMALETVIPITSADFVLGQLDVNAAGRYTDYSISGVAETWKLGAVYKPVADLSVRATYSHDIRAPNHAELFQLRAGTTGGTPVNDPFTNTAPTVQMFTQGNLALTPESANTLGAGLVYQPSWLDGFSASVDYWDINIKNEIGSTSGQTELNLCYNGSRPDLCSLIIRNGAGVITQITSPYINLASRVLQGVDFEASYRADLGFMPGSIALHANSTYSLGDNTVSPGSPNVDALNVVSGTQQLKYVGSVRYDLAPWSTTLAIRGHSGGLINSADIGCVSACPASTLLNPTISLNHMPAAWYFDWSASYDFIVAGNIASTLFLNIKDIENKMQPDLVSYGNQQNNGAYPEYDTDGRTYRIGIRFKM